MMKSATCTCPYCWETIEVLIDCSVERQEYTEDCPVCCRPIILSVMVTDDGIPHCEVRREEE